MILADLADLLTYCGGNLTEVDDRKYVSLSPLLRAKLHISEPVIRLDLMSNEGVDALYSSLQLIASE